MNFFKVLYNETSSALNKFINKYEDYLILIPLVYNNIFINNYINKSIINVSYIVYFYQKRDYYLPNMIDYILNIKLKIYKRLYQKNVDFSLEKVLLYTNLTDNINVTNYFTKKTKNIDIINKYTIDDIFIANNLEFINNNDIRLKLYFKYNDKKYIIYIPYDILITSYIPYPPYSEFILNNYRNNIVIPNYIDQSKKKQIYSLFNLDSKDILHVKINNIDYNNNLMKYFEMIQTPFNDFGLLYNIHIKLLWILSENNIDINEFQKFELKFLNLYFDENAMDLKEHFIILSKNNIDGYLVSNRMKQIIL